jgi:hypothetical protein
VKPEAAVKVFEFLIMSVNKIGSNIWSGNMDDDEEGRTSFAYF